MLNFFLLDAAQGTIILFPLFILHFVLTILIEAYFLKRFSTETYKKSVLYSFEMNIASLIVGILLLIVFADKVNHLTEETSLTILTSMLFLVTLIVEFLIIKLVKRSFSNPSLLKALFIGNTITYLMIVAIMLSL